MAGMNSVTRLDGILYAWLAEADDGMFERAFKIYHDVAFASLVRYLARRASAQEMDLEQIAVDALLKFFSRVGRERREASHSIRQALPQVVAFNLDPFHVRQARRWSSDIDSFRESSMTFTLPEENTLERDWKAEIQALAEKIPPLRRQGCLILDPLRAKEAGRDAVERDEDSEFSLMAEFALSGNAEIEHRYPGALRFIDGTWTVIRLLPLLRLPSNGYLFDMAQSLYLDECKSRNRQKRGGTGASRAAEEEMRHPLIRLDMEDEGDAADAPTATLQVAAVEAASDPESEHGGEEFCQKFFDYLRRPLDAAEEAFHKAAAHGSAKPERKRLESLSRKIDRIVAVLTLRIEGRSQEAIGAALGISRNQVKYIVEQVQDAYQQFAAAGAISHVQ